MSLVEEGRLVKDSRGLSKLCDPLSSSFYPSTISSDGIVGLCVDSMIAIGLSRLQPLRVESWCNGRTMGQVAALVLCNLVLYTPARLFFYCNRISRLHWDCNRIEVCRRIVRIVGNSMAFERDLDMFLQ